MATADEVAADLATFKTQVPTVEEQLLAVQICCYNYTTPVRDITGPTWITLVSAPIPLRILSVALTFEFWSLAASDTAYWQAELARHKVDASTDILATRTTQTTGANANGGITQRKPWTFDAAAWANSDLAVGESLKLRPSPFGTPASNWRLPMVATIRYRPL